MAKIPNSPSEIFQEFSQDMRDVFGEDLISIELFGSGAKGEYIPKKSDINFLVVLTENGIERLSAVMETVKKWHKRRVDVPLFVTREYIESSLDSFPIEFLNMKNYHTLVYGDDVLQDLEIKPEHLRLKCEEQVKGKLLHLREGFLRTGSNKTALKQLLTATVPAFASIFTALLALKQEEIPVKKSEILLKTADVFGLAHSVFADVLGINDKTTTFTKDGLISLTESYIAEIRKLAMIIDKG